VPGPNIINITLKNLRITEWSYGINYGKIDNGRIENDTVERNAELGIYIRYSNNIIVSNNTVSSNGYIYDGWNSGIYIFSSNYNSIEGNTVTLTVTDDRGATDTDTQQVVIWITGDANGDGRVNIIDAATIGLNWGNTA
jgi:parallel beta-helix repeat protein